MLKLKAIENILIKCQQGRSGHANEETRHMLALLEDIKSIENKSQRHGLLPSIQDSPSKSKYLTKSPEQRKVKMILDKFPKNLIQPDNQDKLLDVMNNTFGVSQQDIADLRNAQGTKQMYNT